MGVFSLAGWSRRILAGFHVSRDTQDTATPASSFAYGAVTLYGRSFQSAPLRLTGDVAVLLPPTCVNTRRVWAVPRSLATTGGITVVFSSSGY